MTTTGEGAKQWKREGRGVVLIVIVDVSFSDSGVLVKRREFSKGRKKMHERKKKMGEGESVEGRGRERERSLQ